MVFARQLFDAGTVIYVSQLVRLEYAHSLKRLAPKLDEETQRRFQLHLWDRQRVRERWMTHGFGLLNDFLDQFAYAELGMTHQVVDDALRLIGTINLESYDAAHAALALAAEVRNFATIDTHFMRPQGMLTVHIVHDR